MKKEKLILIYGILAFLVFYFVFKNIKNSIILKNKDRVNIVFYSKETKFYSLAKDDVNYLIKFSPDIEFFIPGGYDYYRLGGLHKLIDLEKKPVIFQRAFSANLGLITDIYFYPKKVEIYYEDNSINDNFPKFKEIFFFNSNANIIDRFLIFFKFIKKNIADFRLINLNKNNFQYLNFIKKYQGYFYKKNYREIDENIQILYKRSYSTAELLSKVLDGEGIRVVDLSQKKELDLRRKCVIYYKEKSTIINDLKNFFSCEIKKDQPEISDIILELNNLEVLWSTK